MAEFRPLEQLELLLGAAGNAQPVQFPPNSRYHTTATKTYLAEDGTEIVYLARRFVPQPDRLQTLREYKVAKGDRLDRMAHELVGDPEMYWQLCDANRTLAPSELEIVGRRLRVTLPEGVATPEVER